MICQSYMSVCDTYCISAGSSLLTGIFLIINAALGAGLLNFPQAFDQAGGITTSIIVQAVSDCNR
jgi:amino acid permease